MNTFMERVNAADLVSSRCGCSELVPPARLECILDGFAICLMICDDPPGRNYGDAYGCTGMSAHLCLKVSVLLDRYRCKWSLTALIRCYPSRLR